MVTQTTAAPRRIRRRSSGSAGWTRSCPTCCSPRRCSSCSRCVVYPLIDGRAHEHGLLPVRAPPADVGLDNYRQALHDPAFLGSLVDDARSSSSLAVALETALGLALALLCAREVRVHPRDPRLADPADDRDTRRRRHRLPADLRLGRRARRHAARSVGAGAARDPRPAERRLRGSGAPGRLGVDAADVPHPARRHPVAAGRAVRGRAGGRRGRVAHVRRPHAADAAPGDPRRRSSCARSTR